MGKRAKPAPSPKQRSRPAGVQAKKPKLTVKKNKDEGRDGPTKSARAPDKPQRKLWRRDSREQAKRAVRLKLGMYPASQLDGNEDEDGNLIEDVVVRELRKMKANKKHLSQGFWKSLIVRHKLSGMTSDSLVQPTVAEGFSRELDAALKLCHEANPARRSCTRLQRYLKYTDTMNSTEVFGVLKASYPSPSLSSSMSRGMLEIVLEWCGRVRADEKYPEYFKVVRCSLDQIMTQMWQRASSDGLSRSHFFARSARR